MAVWKPGYPRYGREISVGGVGWNVWAHLPCNKKKATTGLDEGVRIAARLPELFRRFRLLGLVHLALQRRKVARPSRRAVHE